MAPAAQFWAHAPHSMHPSRSTISAFLPFILNTTWGQTLSHSPQPTHASVSSFSVVTPSRYLKSFLGGYLPGYWFLVTGFALSGWRFEVRGWRPEHSAFQPQTSGLNPRRRLPWSRVGQGPVTSDPCLEYPVLGCLSNKSRTHPRHHRYHDRPRLNRDSASHFFFDPRR